MVPGIYLISVLVGASLSWAVAICTVPLLGLLTPQFHWTRTGGAP